MGRDTIQLENAVSTISQEYLLEFTSEYGIPEDLHPELPGPEDTIVDFPEGKVGVYTRFFEFANFRIPISQFLFDILGYYQIHLSQLSVIGAAKRVFPTVVDWRTSAPKDGMPTTNSYSAADVTVLDTRRTPIQKQPEALLCLVGLSRRYFLGDDVYPTFLYDDDRDMDLFNLISAPNPTKVKTGSRPRAAYEVPLLIVTANRVIDMEDPVATATSSETPSVMEKSPLYFLSEDLPLMITNKGETEDQASAVVSQEVPSAENIATTEGTTPEIPTEGIATTKVNVQFSVGSPESGRLTFAPSIVGSPSGIYQPGWGVTNDCRLDTPEACQDTVDHTVPPGMLKKAIAQVARRNERIQVSEEEIKRLGEEVESLKVVETEVHGLRNQTKNLETLLEAEVDMKKATKAKNAELAKELEILRAKFSDLQLNNNQRIKQRRQFKVKIKIRKEAIISKGNLMSTQSSQVIT
ncbi:hypothetical protein Tco_1500944 [Tanacetum coccineum]